jgi:hypothetical protein
MRKYSETDLAHSDLAEKLTQLFGREPDGHGEHGVGATRWDWDMLRPEFMLHEVDIEAIQDDGSKKPAWQHHRELVSVVWPSQDVFVVSVIKRDPTSDLWCMEPSVAREHEDYRFCLCCHLIHTHCDCVNGPHLNSAAAAKLAT